MQRQAQFGKRPTRQEWRSLRLLPSVLGLFALCWLAGRTSTPGSGSRCQGQRRPPGGWFGPLNPWAAAPQGNTSTKAKSAGVVTPLPPATETGSLTASTINQPLLTSRTLAIDGNKQPTQPGGSWQNPTWNANDTDPTGQPVTNAPAGPAGVTLGKPLPSAPSVQALPSSGSTAEVGQTPATSFASPGVVGDYETLQAQLKARKVVWQRQETFGDGFKFTCGVPIPNSNYQKRYEATARDPRSALAAVLEQMDKER